MANCELISFLNDNLNRDMTRLIFGKVKEMEQIDTTKKNHQRVMKQFTHNVTNMKNTHFQAYMNANGSCMMIGVCDHFDKIFTSIYHGYYFGRYYENIEESDDEESDDEELYDESDEE